MELPVKFPSETDVILEDVARFRRDSPQEQFRALRDLLDAGDLILQKSPKAAWAKQYAEEQELLAQRAIREFHFAPWILTPALFSDELVRAVELLSDAFAVRSIRHALIGGLATSMRQAGPGSLGTSISCSMSHSSPYPDCSMTSWNAVSRSIRRS